MLTETFIASVGVQSNAHRTDAGRDASIVVLEHQPIVQIKTSFKKSVTAPHCLAVSAAHIFAAQQAKALVLVYNIEKNAQEATVPFPERVTAIALACNDTVLIIATCEGKVFLWETTSGRQVQTSQSHLQAVTAIAVDLSSNYFITASADSTAHVWTLSSLLSFETDVDARSPALAFTAHRSSITDVVLGHSSTLQNFATSISADKTCLLWNYRDGSILATFLLSYVPTTVQLDVADRAVYVGYEDGSVQQIDLYEIASSRNQPALNQLTIQPGETRRWPLSNGTDGPMLSMSLGFDSTTLLTGHQSGTVLAWDVATGHARNLTVHPPLPGPITNLSLLPVTIQPAETFTVPVLVKPKFGATLDDTSRIPLNYAMQLQLTSSIAIHRSRFQDALLGHSIPQDMLDHGLDELMRWSQPQANGKHEASTDDYVPLNGLENDKQANLAGENAELKRQLSSLRQVQMATFDRMDRLSAERTALLQREHDRLLAVKNDENAR